MRKRRKADNAYHKETRMIHGNFHSLHWNYKDHIVPPISASAAYRLESAERGADRLCALQSVNDTGRSPRSSCARARSASSAQ